ncbi:GNAT family N-acetyltransferase [Polymorphobacter fuscus]|uniref:GNAT family N-acetyltransferase n=1 Tax=Sandarakinorhabdus fusca TaxID=1439888 RepID=A0A7C9LFY8_9SPHN|nr:GNAT family N-acetyltransferase [Polymorphobacter fuscus]KAB7647750.1 GNAT family N-acetyltransferase [Polymorphobacter fuscus]MQT17047.1 GNAT family N-acetyltransferase [Polymorphobacter fuscus]NJC08961.1 L-amino acid N-acyltransferase YncA [Polymorphobacter fuscus]
MLIRAARADDAPAIWQVIAPVIRAGETYALDRDMTEADALAYWLAPEKTTFVLESDGAILGSYYLRANAAGGGRHVANAGYITAGAASGRGIARAMCAHSLVEARAQGFRAMQFNLVVSTNGRAVALWQAMGFAIVGRLPAAFDHPALGPVDALVMYQSLGSRS